MKNNNLEILENNNFENLNLKIEKTKNNVKKEIYNLFESNFWDMIFSILSKWKTRKLLKNMINEIFSWKYLEDFEENLKMILKENKNDFWADYFSDKEFLKNDNTNFSKDLYFPYYDYYSGKEYVFLLSWLEELNKSNSWKIFDSEKIQWFYEKVYDKKTFIDFVKKYL